MTTKNQTPATSYKGDVSGIPCNVCGLSELRGTAVFSTGVALPHYQPRKGEILRFIAIACDFCGTWQTG